MRRQYSGGAKPTTLAANLGGSTADLSISGTSFANYPDGSVGPFYIVIDRGQVTEEKILCVSRSGNVITVYNSGLTNGRGNDGTSVVAHSAGSTVEHVFTAVDADEANLHVNTASGVHGVSGSVVGTTSTQTLTNKTISGSSNTLSNIAQASVTSLTTDLAAKFPLNPLTNAPTTVTYTLALTDAQKFVEMNYTSVLRTVTTVALTSNVATLTTSVAHGFSVGSIVVVSNITNNSSLFNGTYTVASVPTSTTFTYAKTNANITSTAATGTSPNVYETNRLIIPPNSSVAFPINTSIFVVQTGPAQTTISAGAGVTVNSFIGLKIIGQWAGCTLIKRATDTWVAVGGLVA